jgi:hypothetical protein
MGGTIFTTQTTVGRGTIRVRGAWTRGEISLGVIFTPLVIIRALVLTDILLDLLTVILTYMSYRDRVEVFNLYISRRITSQECLSEIILTQLDLGGRVVEFYKVTHLIQELHQDNLLLISKVMPDMFKLKHKVLLSMVEAGEAALDSKDLRAPLRRDRIQVEEAEAEGVGLVRVVQDQMPLGKVARPKTASVQLEERVVQTEGLALIRGDLVVIRDRAASRLPVETMLEEVRLVRT